MLLKVSAPNWVQLWGWEERCTWFDLLENNLLKTNKQKTKPNLFKRSDSWEDTLRTVSRPVGQIICHSFSTRTLVRNVVLISTRPASKIAPSQTKSFESEKQHTCYTPSPPQYPPPISQHEQVPCVFRTSPFPGSGGRRTPEGTWSE